MPLSRRFFQVDVFSNGPGTGNPLAVIVDDGTLGADQMQAVAAWTNLAETTFLLPPLADGADYRVRIFTPRQEIAFAGHPSIGTAHIALATGMGHGDARTLVQECQAGLLPITSGGPADDPVLSVRVPRSRSIAREAAHLRLLEIVLDDRRQGALAPALVEGGRRWWLAELRDEDEVRQWQPDGNAIAALATASASLGLCVFARCQGQAHDLVVRAFPLGVGIAEDPASGAANAAIAAFLDETGSLGELGDRYVVSQGREIGRDARLLLQLDSEREVWVGGKCRTLVDGTLHW